MHSSNRMREVRNSPSSEALAMASPCLHSASRRPPSLTHPHLSSINSTSRRRNSMHVTPSCSFSDASELQTSTSHRPAGGEECNTAILKISRRDAALKLVLLGCVFGGSVRPWIETPAARATEGKQRHLGIDNVKAIIEDDIRQGQYYVTGNLSPGIYNDNCKFTDPTTVVTGVDKYVAAVKLLFDPELSQQELLSINVTGPHTIEANWRLGGYLKFPWKPHIMPYEGSTRYMLGDDGLVVSHDEQWSISLLTALLELFTPSWGPH